MTREQWRIVPGFEAYEASNHGRIRRRVTAKNGCPKGRELKPWLGLGGRLYVALRADGRTYRFSVDAVHKSAFAPTRKKAS